MVAFPAEQYAAVLRVVDQEIWRRFRLTGYAFDLDDERQDALEGLVQAFARREEMPASVLPFSRIVVRRGILSRARHAAAFKHTMRSHGRNDMRVNESLGREASAETEHEVADDRALGVVDRLAVEQFLARWRAHTGSTGPVSHAANAIDQRIRAVVAHAHRSRRPFDGYEVST